MAYRGGKGSLFRQLINLIPHHDTYIEPYLGMGAVMRNKLPARRSIGVEIDPAIVDRWTGHEIDNLSVINAEALGFLGAFPWTGNEFVYVDPPYLPSTRRMERVYRFDCDETHHRRLLALLNTLPVPVMLSGYASPIYDEALKGWNRVEFRTGSHGSARTEVVWLNYEPPVVPFDTRFAGDSFRERQRIQRKQQRLRQKIMGLPSVERHLLLGWLTEAFPAPSLSQHVSATNATSGDH
jgi:site-specific DNA-adenine methylase